jgi:carbamoyl-phosphate synthase large subunit
MITLHGPAARGIDRPNVLITSASRKVPLVKAFQHATARLGGRVVAADVSPLAAALYEADAARLTPRSDDPNFIDALLELCRRDDVGLIVPTRDEELPVLAAARERFAAEGTLVLVSSPASVEACGDKVRFSEAVAAAGLETPRAFPTPEAVELPAFVKPRRGKGGRGARAVATHGELEAALAAAGADAIVQELMVAPEFTIDAFLDLASRPITCVPRERIQVVAGESVVARTVRDPELVAATLQLCTSLGLVGHLTIQAFRTPTRIAFIEINPRYGGAANLGFAAGARTPELALRLARGEALTPRLDDYEVGLTMLRSASDRFVREAELLRPGRSRSLATAPGARSTTRDLEAVLFDLDDTVYPEHQFVDGGFRAVARMLAGENGPAAEALVQRLWALHAEYGRGRLFDRLLSEQGRGDDRDLVLACVLTYRGHAPRLAPFEGVAELVEELRAIGIATGVVSDGLSAVQRRKLSALGSLGQLFDVVVMTDELGPMYAKPSPVPFRIACRLLGVGPGRTVYVANDPRKDFRGPREAGLRTIRFGTPPDEGGGVDTASGLADDWDDSATSVTELRRLLLGGSAPRRAEDATP